MTRDDDHRVRDRYWDRGFVAPRQREERHRDGVVAEEVGAVPRPASAGDAVDNLGYGKKGDGHAEP